jgi:hypothetical protein
MAKTWFIYGTVSSGAAKRAVDAMYAKLAAIVGEDLAEHLDRGEELEPPTLGFWPDVSVASSGVPAADNERASLTGPGKKAKVRFDEAALKRLAKSFSVIRFDGPRGFDPALVTTLRVLVELLGPCVFTREPGSELITSETLLADLADLPDLPAGMRAALAGERDEDEEEDEADEDEDDEDEDEEEDEDDEEVDEDEDEPAPDSARPETLRGTLAAMAELPRARRKASELMGSAPEIVVRLAERLARVGVETDAVAARALGVKDEDVVAARKALAKLLRRAENR